MAVLRLSLPDSCRVAFIDLKPSLFNVCFAVYIFEAQLIHRAIQLDRHARTEFHRLIN